MSATAATLHSASCGEDAGEIKTSEVRVSEAFSSPSGNVILKSSDNVIFRVEDFYLKANRDMLSDSVPSSSVDNPLPLDENSVDLEIMLSIIAGRPSDNLHRASNWKHAERLYRMVDKYQLDGHMPWFVQMCCAHADEEPWEALFLACNQSPMQTTLIAAAISRGFRTKDDATLCDLRYFKEPTIWNGISHFRTKAHVLDASNMTVELGFRLGFKGLVAYNLTFRCLVSGISSWESLAERFVENAVAVELRARNATGNN